MAEGLLALLPLAALLGRHLPGGLLGQGALAVGEILDALGALQFRCLLAGELLEGVHGALRVLQAADELPRGGEQFRPLGGGGLDGGLLRGKDALLEEGAGLGGDGVERPVGEQGGELAGDLLGAGEVVGRLDDAVVGGLLAAGLRLAAGGAGLVERAAQRAAHVPQRPVEGVLVRGEALGAETAVLAGEADDDLLGERRVRAVGPVVGGQVVEGPDAELDAAAAGEGDLRQVDAGGAGPDQLHGRRRTGDLADVEPLAAAEVRLKRDGSEAEVVLDGVGDRDRAVVGQVEHEVRRIGEADGRGLVAHDFEHAVRDGVGVAVVVPEPDGPGAGHAVGERELPLDRPVVRGGAGDLAVGQLERAVERAVGRCDQDHARALQRGNLLRPRRERALRGAGVGGEAQDDFGVVEVGHGHDAHRMVLGDRVAALDAVGEGVFGRREREGVLVAGGAVAVVHRKAGHALGGLAAAGVVEHRHEGVAGVAAVDREVHGEGLAAQDDGGAGRDDEVAGVDVADFGGGGDGAQEQAEDALGPEDEQGAEDRQADQHERQLGADGARGELAARGDAVDLGHGRFRDDAHELLGAVGQRVGGGHQLDDRREALLQLGVVALDEGGETRRRELLRERAQERDARHRRHGAHARQPRHPPHQVRAGGDHRVHRHAAEDGENDRRGDGQHAADDDDAADARPRLPELAGDRPGQLAERDVGDAGAGQRGGRRALAEEAGDRVHGGRSGGRVCGGGAGRARG